MRDSRGLPPQMEVRALLRRFGIRPSKRLGQNFLLDPKALDRVVAAAELTGQETVLEIGAGLGSLTSRLARSARRVIAVEYDRRLIPVLEEVVGGIENIELISGDILSLDLAGLLGQEPYRVVANIPYNITSAVIRRLMETPQPADRVVLTVQQEVAERVVSGPGAMSLLAISVQLYGVPTITARIPSRAFYPQPKVDSAVLRIDIYSESQVSGELMAMVFRLARAGFGQKRKQLRNSLAGGLGLSPVEVTARLDEAAIPPSRRAQELSLAEWVRLAEVFAGKTASA
jgi:16S rRNA (adenine1518-N6/adenine1519-N6)-dimethyltransferase